MTFNNWNLSLNIAFTVFESHPKCLTTNDNDFGYYGNFEYVFQSVLITN